MCIKRILFFAALFFCLAGYSQDEKHPIEIPDSCLFVPNTITPDCDQVGCELLTVYLACEITDFKLVIFNQFGELVFESNSIEDQWSSTDAEGTYVWQITGTMSDSGTPFAVSASGNILVLK